MSAALCCKITSTWERVSTRSRISSVRFCNCCGVLGISIFSTSLATASILSRSALSSEKSRQKSELVHSAAAHQYFQGTRIYSSHFRDKPLHASGWRGHGRGGTTQVLKDILGWGRMGREHCGLTVASGYGKLRPAFKAEAARWQSFTLNTRLVHTVSQPLRGRTEFKTSLVYTVSGDS